MMVNQMELFAWEDDVISVVKSMPGVHTSLNFQFLCGLKSFFQQFPNF